MDHFDEILNRADIQHIREFMINGIDDSTLDPRPYEERQQAAEKPMMEFLEKQFPDEQERSNAWEQILPALCENQAIFLEIGMKAGARLVCQLFKE